MTEPLCGGVNPANANDQEIFEVFKAAIDKKNQENSTNIQLIKVLNATQQVVAGMIYEGDVETSDGKYHVKFWEKAWEHFLQVDVFQKI